MRKKALLLLFFSVMLLIGVVWFGVHPQSLPQVSRALSSLGIGSSAKKPTPLGDTSGKPTKLEEPIHFRPRRRIPEAPQVVSVDPPTPRAPEVHYRFPLADEIQSGTARTTVMARFGPPLATVTGADRGQLLERLIYADKANNRRTQIWLVNGKVTAAETLTQ